MTDADRLEVMATELEAEVARLKAEVASQQEIFAEAVRHCRTVEQVALETHLGLDAEVARLAAENASLREQGRVVEGERDRARQERDETIADYYEDLADCLKTVEAERDAARGTVERLTAKCNRMCRSAKIEDITGVKG